MNNYLLEIILLVSVVSITSCTPVRNRNDASIHFNAREYNFGTVSYKKEAEYSFEFSNPGKTPLVISNVETSCGCTVADWTKKPVKPGAKGVIKINYDADFPGTFNKTITVHFNGEGSPVTLHIKGLVDYPEDLQEPAE